MSPGLLHPRIARVLLRGQKGSKTVDPISQGELSYVFRILQLFHGKDATYSSNTMDPVGWKLQVTKLLSYPLLANQITEVKFYEVIGASLSSPHMYGYDRHAVPLIHNTLCAFQNILCKTGRML